MCALKRTRKACQNRPGASVFAISGAVFGVGIAYGALSVSAGLPAWFAPVLGLAVLAASAEMMFVGMVATGASPLLASLFASMINSRHVPYGFAVRDALGFGKRRWLRAHLINDESVAMALAEHTTTEKRAALTSTGLAVFTAWPAGAVVGGFIGHVISAEDIGLDAVFPVVLASLLAPNVANRTLRTPLAAAAAGVFIAGFGLPSQIAVFAAIPFMWLPRKGET